MEHSGHVQACNGVALRLRKDAQWDDVLRGLFITGNNTGKISNEMYTQNLIFVLYRNICIVSPICFGSHCAIFTENSYHFSNPSAYCKVVKMVVLQSMEYNIHSFISIQA